MCNIYCTTGLFSFFTGTYTQDSQYIYFPTHVNGSERKRANGVNSSRALAVRAAIPLLVNGSKAEQAQ